MRGDEHGRAGDILLVDADPVLEGVLRVLVDEQQIEIYVHCVVHRQVGYRVPEVTVGDADGNTPQKEVVSAGRVRVRGPFAGEPGRHEVVPG